MRVLQNKALTCWLRRDRKRRSLKASVYMSISGLALGLGLMVSPGYGGQQSSQGSNSGRPEQAAAPKTSPISAPVQETPPLPSATATPGAEPSPGETISIDSALQTQIQDAFDKDPTFSQGGLKVTVVGDGIELTGDVASGRDRQNAARIAQSYARGKKVVNHVVVRGHSTPPGAASPQNPPANLSSPAGVRAANRNNPP
jgi:osmotically-inducible protein OsmY